MARELHVDTAAAVAGEIVTRVVAVALEFASGAVRLNSGTDTLEIDGDDYLPAGVLGSIASIEETAELASTTLRMSLAGVPVDLVNVALGEAYQNRAAVVWEVVMDPDTGLIVGDPVKTFAGRMDVMRVTASGETCTIELDVTNRLVDWERPRRVLFSDEEQRRATGGTDTSFRYAAGMASRDVAWPTGQYFRKVLYNVT